MNKVELIGRITKDIALKKTPDGVSVLSFTIAVPRYDKNKNVDFIKCVAWRSTADLMNQYLHKGSLVGVTGRVTAHSWEKDGQMQYKTEVTVDDVDFLDPKPKDEAEFQPTDEAGLPF